MADRGNGGDVSETAVPKTPETGVSDADAEVQVDLNAALKAAKEKADEYLDQLRRTAADFANYRKRVEKEREEIIRFGNVLLMTKLLPVLDDLDRAFATLPSDLRRLTWFDGVALIDRRLRLILEQEGLQAIECLGKQFDPTEHEAVLYEETTEVPDGQILAELQRGYKAGDRVIRPALVKVAKAPAASQRDSAVAGPDATIAETEPAKGSNERKAGGPAEDNES
ncbi:MAG: nucleotide exchange factor GrpE [Chloroflexi bacterium]|nr:nucleotide exchange factor GrpE [Chloroflexota bacterium]